MTPRALLLSVVAGLVAGPAAATPAGPGVDTPAGLALLHVEANVGSASGGHVALRVDDVVYNFQFESADDVPGGLLVLLREPWERALYRYGTLENRPLHVARVPVSERQLARVRDRFDGLYLEQQAALDALRRGEADLAYLEALAGSGEGVPVRGAGLLDPARPGAPGLAPLRRRIARELGAGALARARTAAARERAQLAVLDAQGRVIAENVMRRRELLAEEFALRALEQGFGLAPGVWTSDPSGRRLGAAERAVLADFAADLERCVLELLSSPRPDRGPPLLLAMARRLAVERSLREGRLVLLDPIPDVDPSVSAAQAAKRHEEIEAAAADAGPVWEERRDALLSAPLDEIRYNRLEELAARYRELLRASAGEGGLRLLRGPFLPMRARRVSIGASPHRGELSAAAESARRDLSLRRARLADRYGYRLLSENCVHAMVDTLAEGLGGRDALREALGVEADPVRGLGFVPWVFFAQARARLGGGSVERIPSHRERALAALYRRGWDPAVYARESNRLTSTIYRPRDPDGSFLFFTSDALAPRPLYGALNLAWALGDGVLGVATAPFDRGDRIVRAARGLFFSAPELVFLNFRKGSFDAASLAADPTIHPRPIAR